MKVLRILTGSHAGARMCLTDGRWTVASPHEGIQPAAVGMICLEGWSAPDLVLDVEEGICSAGADKRGRHVWPDFETRRFGDIALCVGEDEAAWPDDLALLSQLVQPTAAPPIAAVLSVDDSLTAKQLKQAKQAGKTGHAEKTEKTEKTGGGRVAFALICLAGLVTLLVTSPSRSAKSLEGSIRSGKAAAQLKRAMGANRWSRPARIVEPAFRGAPLDMSQILDAVRSALHGQGVTVSDIGEGRLAVSGVTSQPDQVREIAERLSQDLAPGLKSIDVDVTAPVVHSRISARLETGATAYAVRPDGTKIFNH